MTIDVKGIKCLPEGRKGIWLVDKDSLKTWISARDWGEDRKIHCFRGFIGADWDVEEVLANCEKATIIVIRIPAFINHHLKMRVDGDWYSYNIGKITETDIQEQTCRKGEQWQHYLKLRN